MQESVLRQGYVQCPVRRTFYSVRASSNVRGQNSLYYQGFVHFPSGRTLSSVWGMSSGLEEDFCPAPKVCAVSGWQNSFQHQGVIQCPRGQMSYVSDMSSGLEAKLCLVSGVCPVSGWQKSF
ncbi:hypothetical protein TNCV_2886901 [Trichonephila clavipes]|nr:hypothetical protein TNCV_2886901 [Trichonephila clavipes]